MIDFRHIEPFLGDKSQSKKATSREGTAFLNRIGGRFWAEEVAKSSKLQVSLYSVFQEATHEHGNWAEQDKCAFITQHTGHGYGSERFIGTMFAYLHRKTMCSQWGRRLLNYCRQDMRGVVVEALLLRAF